MYKRQVKFALHGFMARPFLLTLMGFMAATSLYLVKPEWRAAITHALKWPIRVLENKYWMDDLWIGGLAGGSVALGRAARWFDSTIVDGTVNAAARVTDLAAGVLRKVQSGYLYHYAFAMILGLIALLAIVIARWH